MGQNNVLSHLSFNLRRDGTIKYKDPIKNCRKNILLKELKRTLKKTLFH